ncbi:hypothetical protein LIER_40962 [Lithospermum erythrorhizon]|uniref:Uncharacterized protein n=1 Tax=Lithospermum erythrorhizon TaxID=34254 RepID=A0AAV3R542_LITER
MSVIANFDLGRMPVDTGISMDILLLDAYLKLRMSRAQVRPVATPLVRFTRDAVSSLRVAGDHGKASAANHRDGGVYHHRHVGRGLQWHNWLPA